MTHRGIKDHEGAAVAIDDVRLAVTPVGSLAQEPTEAPSIPPSEEAQNTTKAPPPSSSGADSGSATPTPAQTQGPPPNIENTAEAAEPMPRRDLVHWNEYQGPHFTIRVGAGFLYDFSAFAQDKESKEQIAVLPGEKPRDFRFIMGGRLPSIPLPTTWCAGVMYDGPTSTWFLRQTGIHVPGPEDLELLLHRAPKRGLLSQQSHGRLRRLDHGEIHLQRRDHSAAGGRFQVDWLFEEARLSLERRLLTTTWRPKASRSPRTPARRSYGLHGSPCIQRRRAR